MMTAAKTTDAHPFGSEEQLVMPPREPTPTCPFGPDLQKYWDYLSLEERNMQMDIPGLYSLTPRELAQQIATTLKGDSVFDAFCGLGGNAIAFALAGKEVLACEIDEGRLAMAKANAQMAGVSDRIQFILGDATTWLEKSGCDAVFFDPPWGGPQYSKQESFKLGYFSPDGDALLASAIRTRQSIAFKLPRNFDFVELQRYGEDLWQKQENRLNGKLLHFTAYRQ